MKSELPQWVHFGREICGDLQQAERREWWLGNGRGGYAAGTIGTTLTRCYHGLLIASVQPPLGRRLVVAKADAVLTLDGREFALFANRWTGGAIEPTGYLDIESFALDGRMPVWRFRGGGACVEMRIWMEPGANTSYVAFRLEGADAAPLCVHLLANARDHHACTAVNGFEARTEIQDETLVMTVAGQFALRVQAVGGALVAEHTWYENFDLPVERVRGLGDRDNHLCIGKATLTLRRGQWSGLVLSLQDHANADLPAALSRFRDCDAAQLRRARERVPQLRDAPEWIDQLLLAADSFLFTRPLPDGTEGESVVAGYPWFGDWGRDTMIALPGLTLATGRYESARRILTTFAGFIDGGLLPNVFPDAGATPEYNSADASLWYIEAWRAYCEASGDEAALRAHFDALDGIVESYCKGTRYGIGVDPADGLVHAGESGMQLSWMDAKVGDWVVTPRSGKPVEINALWFNAASAMAELARRSGRPDDKYRKLASRAQAGFARFRHQASGGLFDVLDGPGGDDAALRPNQILAASLHYSPLDATAQQRMVALCGRELLTSYGLRTLAPSQPGYRGRYEGGVRERDGAYHQGPVWPWLLGHYALAEARVTGDPAAAQQRLLPLRDHLLDAGLGTISELLDGEPPHRPRGAPSQAWSVACTLEAWWRLQCLRR
jgi:4-alpha-glucanotransferase